MNENIWTELPFGYFKDLTRIPRASGEEGDVLEWISKVIATQRLMIEDDKVGNMLITLPASSRYVKQKVTTLQAHVDMKCVGKDGNFGPEGFPLKLKVDGDWISADGTTLGADNGMGVAAMIAIANDTTLKRGPINLLFTVQEETGLHGASKLGLDIDSEYLINLDGNRFGECYIGCAGSFRASMVFDTAPLFKSPFMHRIEKDVYSSWKIRVGGLQGGHSGFDILGRSNAIRKLAGFFNSLKMRLSDLNYFLAEINGGDEDNSIPTWAEATCIFNRSAEEIKHHLLEVAAYAEEVMKRNEPAVNVKLIEVDKPSMVISSNESQTIMSALLTLPPTLIELLQCSSSPKTSLNVGTVKTAEGRITVRLMGRSSSAQSLQDLKSTLIRTDPFPFVNVTIESENPPWEPQNDTELLRIAEGTYEELTGRRLGIGIVHAGLESAYIGGHDMQKISIGPTIEAEHSINERVSISSVRGFYSHLKAILEEISS